MSFEIDPPALEPSFGEADTLWIAFATYQTQDSPTSVSAYPLFYSDGIDQNQIFNVSWVQGVAGAIRELASDIEDPGPFTVDGNNWALNIGIVVAIKAEPEPPPPGGGSISGRLAAFKIIG